MRALIVGLLALLWAGVAAAGEAPRFGPADDWVQAVEIPPADESQGGPAQILLQDMQVRFTDEGLEQYARSAYRLATPMGLSALGNIGVTWNPELDEITIHHLRAHRGEEVIDLLGDGKGFTVLRREENLDSAMLDGMLTATIQPVGLEVGDIVDFAFSIHRRDPVMEGRSELSTANFLTAPIGRLHLRGLWPKDRKTRYRLTEGLPRPKVTTRGGETELVIDTVVSEPLKIPASAPARYSEVGYLELSQFASWGEVASLIAPHYEKAVVLADDSPVKAEADRIRARFNDPKAQAAAALRLVQDRVRYVFLGMDNGRYLPASAEETWARRFGDCKGKSVLLVALLRELGIEAEPVLGSISRNDGLEARLPQMGAFDHVFVRAVIDGKVYWLDGARTGDRRIDEPVLDYRWALPIRAAGAELERLPDPRAVRPQIASALHVDASEGLDVPAKARGEMVLTGVLATQVRTGYENLTGPERDEYLRGYWKWDSVKIEPEKTAASFNDADGSVTLTMEGSAVLDWSGELGSSRWHLIEAGDIGWEPDYERKPGPHADAPFRVNHPMYVTVRQTVVLPNQGQGFLVEGKSVEHKIGVWELSREVSLDQGVVTVDATARSLAPEISHAEALATVEPLKQANKDRVYIQAPWNYRPTPAEVAARAKETPRTADEYITRGVYYLNRQDGELAVRDFSEAARLDPNDQWAFSNRALAYLNLGRLDEAQKDVERALSLDPNFAQALTAKAGVAAGRGDHAQAIEALTRALALAPEMSAPRLNRARLYTEQRDYEKALADLAVLAGRNDRDPMVLEARIEALQAQGKFEDALVDADRLVGLYPKDAGARLTRANLLLLLRRFDEARAEYDASLAIEPIAGAYIGRSQTWDEDHDKAIADVLEAMRLEPGELSATRLLARNYVKAGREDEALAIVDAAVKAAPKEPGPLYLKTGILEDLKRHREAVAVASELIAISPDDPRAFNARCWARGLAGIELDGALADCNAALELRPDMAAFLDSRGLIHLRRGELDKAIADYDAALKLVPGMAASLYGRGLTRLRQGLTAEGEADLAAARKANPTIDDEFAGAGLTP